MNWRVMKSLLWCFILQQHYSVFPFAVNSKHYCFTTMEWFRRVSKYSCPSDCKSVNPVFTVLVVRDALIVTGMTSFELPEATTVVCNNSCSGMLSLTCCVVKFWLCLVLVDYVNVNLIYNFVFLEEMKWLLLLDLYFKE